MADTNTCSIGPLQISKKFVSWDNGSLQWSFSTYVDHIWSNQPCIDLILVSLNSASLTDVKTCENWKENNAILHLQMRNDHSAHHPTDTNSNVELSWQIKFSLDKIKYSCIWCPLFTTEVVLSANVAITPIQSQTQLCVREQVSSANHGCTSRSNDQWLMMWVNHYIASAPDLHTLLLSYYAS